MAPYGSARAICVFSGAIREAIHDFKYQNKPYLAKALAALVDRSSLQLGIDTYDMLVPVPLHRRRLKKRGYNQSLLLAREVGRHHLVFVEENLLKRVKDSAPQVELAGLEREQNVKGAFGLEGDPGGKRILLLDDVFTTGATTKECTKVLRLGGASEVDILTIARAVP